MSLKEHERLAVFKRDDYRCRYCGVRYTNKRTGEPISSYFDNAPAWCGGSRWVGLLHVDHVIPVSAGGLSTLSNLVTACRTCNLVKGPRYNADHVHYVREIERRDADRQAASFADVVDQIGYEDYLRRCDLAL